MIYIATIETANFTFEGVGTNETEARMALNEGLIFHARQYNLPTNWARSGYDVEIRTLEIGTAYRDGQKLAAI